MEAPARGPAVRAPHLVLGLGNELFHDEGVGVVAARRFAELGLPDVEVVDGGTLGIALLPTVVERTSILVFDAVVASEAAPGDILVLEGDDVRRADAILYSAHQLGVGEVLAAADLAGGAPAHLAAVGLVPFSLETGYGVTPDAEARIPAMIAKGRELLAAWGAVEAVDA